jgi:hypothetical protein
MNAVAGGLSHVNLDEPITDLHHAHAYAVRAASSGLRASPTCAPRVAGCRKLQVSSTTGLGAGAMLNASPVRSGGIVGRGIETVGPITS